MQKSGIDLWREGPEPQRSARSFDGGTYLHIANHPCFMTPVWGWVRDEEGRRLHRKVDHYFQRGPFLCPWGAKSGMEPTVYWHRTLGDIMNQLIRWGVEPKTAFTIMESVRKGKGLKPDWTTAVKAAIQRFSADASSPAR